MREGACQGPRTGTGADSCAGLNHNGCTASAAALRASRQGPPSSQAAAVLWGCVVRHQPSRGATSHCPTLLSRKMGWLACCSSSAVPPKNSTWRAVPCNTGPCPAMPQALHRTVNLRIAEFQEGVARRAAARAADPSWFYERLWRMLRSRAALRGALAAARPSPWGTVVLLMIGSFLKSIVEQFAQVGEDFLLAKPLCCLAGLHLAVEVQGRHSREPGQGAGCAAPLAVWLAQGVLFPAAACGRLAAEVHMGIQPGIEAALCLSVVAPALGWPHMFSAATDLEETPLESRRRCMEPGCVHASAA
jgi:hypothetical protein